MLKALILKQLRELFQNYFVDRKTGKARSGERTALFFLLFASFFGILGFSFYKIANELCGAAIALKMNWMFFSVMAALSMALGVFGSVFNTYAAVYLPKDNNLLLSLPIPPGTLLLSRLSGVYITSLMYSALVWVPTLIAYWKNVPASLSRVLFPLLLTFLIALFVTVLSCALGWLVALIASKAKGKSFLTVLLTLLLIVGYIFAETKIISILDNTSALIENLQPLLTGRLRFLWQLGLAADGNGKAMLTVTGIILLLAALCFLIMGRTFMKIALASQSATSRRAKGDPWRKLPREKAMLRREFKHFLSSPTWMLNGGLGLVLIPVLAVFAFVKRSQLQPALDMMKAMVPSLSAFLPAVLGIGICMNPLTASSVSMEGKNLWLIQSLPVSPWEVLKEKENMGIRLNLFSSILSALLLGAVLKMNAVEMLLSLAAVWLLVRLLCGFGLFLNLQRPNFTWTSEAYLTKQSLPVIIDLFGGWIFCAALGVGVFFLGKKLESAAILAIMCVFLGAMVLLLRRWLKKHGTAIFSSL